MENVPRKENDFERLDLQPEENIKRWSNKLVIITIIFAIIFLISPLATLNLVTSISSFFIALIWLIVCIASRNKYKVLPLIIIDAVMLIINTLILHSHIIMYSIK